MKIKSKLNVHFFVFFVFCSFVQIFAQKNSPTELIPIKTLFSEPEKSNVKISPDGKIISYLALHNGIKNIWIKTIDIDKDGISSEALVKEDQQITNQSNNGIKDYFWHYDCNHVLYLCDKNNDGSCNLYMKDLQTKEEVNVTPFEGLIVGSILSYKKETPDELLITIKKSLLLSIKVI